MKRAAFFVDGFNFYHPVARRAHFQNQPHLKWMSYWLLAERLIPRSEALESVKIFSAYATHLPASMRRHRLAVRAWESEGCQCIMGKFKRKQVHCAQCRQETPHREEKESDVNIAIHLLNDARHNRMDVAYVLSNDSDIAPALRMCSQEYPNIELVAVAPPGQQASGENGRACSRMLTVSWQIVEACQLPQHIYDASGNRIATRPTEYDPPGP